MNFRNKGFTLVEVFLAAALLSIVLLTIFSAYTSGIRIWRTVKGVRFVSERRVPLSIEKVRRELAGYVRDFEEIEFEGNGKSLSFPGISDSGIVEITYLFDKGRHAFSRKSVKFSDSLKDKMRADVAELFSARKVEFSYLYYDEEEGAGVWLSDFSEEDDGIPEAVKLDITIGKKKFSRFVFLPR